MVASQDITFCTNGECDNTECDKHQSHIDWSVTRLFRMFAEFEGTRYCPKQKEVKKDG